MGATKARGVHRSAKFASDAVNPHFAHRVTRLLRREGQTAPCIARYCLALRSCVDRTARYGFFFASVGFPACTTPDAFCAIASTGLPFQKSGAACTSATDGYDCAAEML